MIQIDGITVDEFTEIISDVVRSAMANPAPAKTPEKEFIKGIVELAKFLRVSPPRAQKLKNEGAFPYWQNGRTVLFDPDKVREAMAVYTQSKTRRR